MKKTFLFLVLLLVITSAATAQFTTAEYLDINKVKARFMVHGDMFWDPATSLQSYEFPKGSGKHAGFASSFWVGGIAQNTQNLHLAAQLYRNNGNDYWPGPLDITTGASDTLQAANWAQIWKVNKSTIDSFLAITNHTIANTPTSILEWPGRQNMYAKTPSNNALTIPNRAMAPFVDVNNDNVYNALDGDYPLIKGEQMLWWVFNDNSAPHTESGGLPLKIEIHASAYACNQPGLENTTFLNYKMYNFSNTIYDSTVITFWNDMDLGYAFDDYIGFDSASRMGICYNGDLQDEGPNGYGFNLTQKGAVIIKQPNDLGNYRAPVGSFTYSFNGGGPRVGDPTTAMDYYYLMTGRWKNGDNFMEGCNPQATTGTPSKYCYPDDPSIVSGVSQLRCNIPPQDFRFLLSSSPFTLAPGVVPLEFTYAFINTDTGTNNGNFNELRSLADSAYKYPDGCGSALATSVTNLSNSTFQVFPNPTDGFFMIVDTDKRPKSIKLYSTLGQLVHQQSVSDEIIKINTNNFSDGLYFLKIEKGGQQFSQRLLIR